MMMFSLVILQWFETSRIFYLKPGIEKIPWLWIQPSVMAGLSVRKSSDTDPFPFIQVYIIYTRRHMGEVYVYMELGFMNKTLWKRQNVDYQLHK